MTPMEFAAKMQGLVERKGSINNPEYNHEEADALLCEVLRGHGYDDGVKIFEEMEKWYH